MMDVPQSPHLRLRLSPSEREALGKPLHTVTHPAMAQWYKLFWAGVCLVGSASLSLQIADTTTWNDLMVLIVSVLIFAVGGLYFLSSFADGLQQRLVVFEHGLAFRSTNLTYVLLWREVEGVIFQPRTFYGVLPLIMVIRYWAIPATQVTVIAHRGVRLFAVAYRNQAVGSALNVIFEQTRFIILERLLANFERQGVLKFGQIALTAQSLTIGKQIIAWTDIANCRVVVQQPTQYRSSLLLEVRLQNGELISANVSKTENAYCIPPFAQLLMNKAKS